MHSIIDSTIVSVQHNSVSSSQPSILASFSLTTNTSACSVNLHLAELTKVESKCICCSSICPLVQFVLELVHYFSNQYNIS